MPRPKLILAALVSAIPVQRIRVALYRLFRGYRFAAGAQVGLFVVIDVERIDCGERVILGRGTLFKGPMHVKIGADTYIGRQNVFECGDGVADASKAHMNYARTLDLGTHCLVSDGHYFDVYGRIRVGDGSWIAGKGSQFWTHGASAMDRDIEIGCGCYIGSMTGFAPGSGIADKVIVGMGAIVSRRMLDSNVVVGGVPARVIRARPAEGGDYHFSRWDTPAPATPVASANAATA